MSENGNFPWPSHYGHFNFFEQRMEAHSRVASLTTIGDGLYELTLKSGKPLRIFICECYSFGVAEYVETVAILGKLDAVVINSVWCGYTWEAKKHCRDVQVGLYKIRDFMAALNKKELWTYLDEFELEHFKKNGWL